MILLKEIYFSLLSLMLVFVLVLPVLVFPVNAEASNCSTVVIDSAAWRCCNFKTHGTVCVAIDIIC